MEKTLNQEEITMEVKKIIGDHEYLKKSYFHSPNSTASGRRKNENQYETEINFKNEKGDEYSIKRNYKESRKNIYYSLEIYVNGKRKDIRALKALIK